MDETQKEKESTKRQGKVLNRKLYSLLVKYHISKSLPSAKELNFHFENVTTPTTQLKSPNKRQNSQILSRVNRQKFKSWANRTQWDAEIGRLRLVLNGKIILPKEEIAKIIRDIHTQNGAQGYRHISIAKTQATFYGKYTTGRRFFGIGLSKLKKIVKTCKAKGCPLKNLLHNKKLKQRLMGKEKQESSSDSDSSDYLHEEDAEMFGHVQMDTTDTVHSYDEGSIIKVPYSMANTKARTDTLLVPCTSARPAILPRTIVRPPIPPRLIMRPAIPPSTSTHRVILPRPIIRIGVRKPLPVIQAPGGRPRLNSTYTPDTPMPRIFNVIRPRLNPMFDSTQQYKVSTVGPVVNVPGLTTDEKNSVERDVKRPQINPKKDAIEINNDAKVLLSYLVPSLSSQSHYVPPRDNTHTLQKQDEAQTDEQRKTKKHNSIDMKKDKKKSSQIEPQPSSSGPFNQSMDTSDLSVIKGPWNTSQTIPFSEQDAKKLIIPVSFSHPNNEGPIIGKDSASYRLFVSKRDQEGISERETARKDALCRIKEHLAANKREEYMKTIILKSKYKRKNNTFLSNRPNILRIQGPQNKVHKPSGNKTFNTSNSSHSINNKGVASNNEKQHLIDSDDDVEVVETNSSFPPKIRILDISDQIRRNTPEPETFADGTNLTVSDQETRLKQVNEELDLMNKNNEPVSSSKQNLNVITISNTQKYTRGLRVISPDKAKEIRKKISDYEIANAGYTYTSLPQLYPAPKPLFKHTSYNNNNVVHTSFHIADPLGKDRKDCDISSRSPQQPGCSPVSDPDLNIFSPDKIKSPIAIIPEEDLLHSTNTSPKITDVNKSTLSSTVQHRIFVQQREADYQNIQAKSNNMIHTICKGIIDKQNHSPGLYRNTSQSYSPASLASPNKWQPLMTTEEPLYASARSDSPDLVVVEENEPVVNVVDETISEVESPGIIESTDINESTGIIEPIVIRPHPKHASRDMILKAFDPTLRMKTLVEVIHSMKQEIHPIMVMNRSSSESLRKKMLCAAQLIRQCKMCLGEYSTLKDKEEEEDVNVCDLDPTTESSRFS